MENVVPAMVFPGPLNGHHLRDALHHTDDVAVPARVGADGAQAAFGQAMASRAVAHTFVERGERVGEVPCVGGGLAQEVKSESCRALLADAWQTGQ